mmetsp:Transcript_72579/g.191331  ORF Transcript_72579/g.191331 Transcript_72579/m.191331 type:complete len:322 (+) Transcript_72579:47-1012(+)
MADLGLCPHGSVPVRFSIDEMRCETPADDYDSDGVLGLSWTRRSAPAPGRRSRAQTSRARMRARCFRRGAACALGPPGLSDLGLDSSETIALLKKCQQLEKLFYDMPGSNDHDEECECLKLDDGIRKCDVGPRSAEDPTTRDEHEPRRNDEHASDDIAEDLCECDEPPGQFVAPVDIDNREVTPDCDDDFATEGVLHDLLAISLFDDLRDRDEYRSQCGEEHGKYLVDDVDEIEDRCDEIVEDRRCALYGEGPLEILQFGNSFFSVTDALQSSVVSRTCQRGISSLWVSPQKKWSEVLRRLEDSFERFEEMLLGDAADGGA